MGGAVPYSINRRTTRTKTTTQRKYLDSGKAHPKNVEREVGGLQFEKGGREPGTSTWRAGEKGVGAIYSVKVCSYSKVNT